MKTFKNLALLALSLFLVVACGSNGSGCPTGESMLNGVCTTSGAYSTVGVVTATPTPSGPVQSADATDYWNHYRQCGVNMAQGYQTCTCVGGLVYSIQYMRCVYPTQGQAPTNCTNGWHYLNGVPTCW